MSLSALMAARLLMLSYLTGTRSSPLLPAAPPAVVVLALLPVAGTEAVKENRGPRATGQQRL
eukprot:2840119-Alexandrium_andersonii.AAC.1